jgi:hypothetical protein
MLSLCLRSPENPAKKANSGPLHNGRGRRCWAFDSEVVRAIRNISDEFWEIVAGTLEKERDVGFKFLPPTKERESLGNG